MINHPVTDELLTLAFAGGAGDSRVREHVSGCAECSTELGELESLQDVLRDPSVWDEVDGASSVAEIDALRAFAASLQLDDEAGTRLLEDVLRRPESRWNLEVGAEPAYQTAGFVRALISRAQTSSDESPQLALSMATVAVEIASLLDVKRYDADFLLELRGMSSERLASVLMRLGRIPEAQTALDRAEECFDQLAVSEPALARVWYLRAVILQEQLHLAKARELALASAVVFRRFGELRRVAYAELLAGAIDFQSGDFERARDTFMKLVPIEESLGDRQTLARLYQNIGNCSMQLGQLEEARGYLSRAGDEFRVLGMHAEAVRTVWSVGRLLLRSGQREQAVEALSQARLRFQELGMRTDGALVGLEVAELFLSSDEEQDQVVALCQDAVRSLQDAGMRGGVATAIQYLQDGLRRHAVTIDAIRDLRGQLADAGTSPPAI